MEDDADTSLPVARRAVVVGSHAGLANAVAGALFAEGVEVSRSFDDTAGPLDVLVFIARDGGPTPIAATPAPAFSAALGGELKAAFLALQRGAAAMRLTGRGGSVVFVAPASADHRAYDALQQGLRLLARSAALELGPEGIRVNMVLPGAGETPLGPPCTPADVAASVAFVASDRAHFMTGADLVVDGGRMAR